LQTSPGGALAALGAWSAQDVVVRLVPQIKATEGGGANGHKSA